MSAPIFAATEWNTNADMILDMRKLGYLRDSDHVYDPTYGKGNWWKRWRPESFLGTDLDPKAGGVDFRKTPWPDESFDAITYDERLDDFDPMRVLFERALRDRGIS